MPLSCHSQDKLDQVFFLILSLLGTSLFNLLFMGTWAFVYLMGRYVTVYFICIIHLLCLAVSDIRFLLLLYRLLMLFSVRSLFQSYLIFFALDVLYWHRLSHSLVLTICWSVSTVQVLYASVQALFFM